MTRLVWAAVALGAAQLIVGVGVSMTENPEGWAGGVMYAAMYAAPLFLIAAALRSGDRRWRLAAGWAAFLLGALYVLVVIGNWSGYSPAQSTFAIAVTVPTALLDAAIFWVAVVRDRRRLTA